MSERLNRCVLIFLFLSGLAPGAAAQRRIDACGTLDQPRSTYILQNDVSSPGTCFLIRGDGITLDLNSHTVTYGTASSWKPGEETVQHVHGVLGQACWDTGGHAAPPLCGDGFSMLAVKNGSIVEAGHAPPYSHAIRLGQGPMRNLTIENVRFNISSPSTAAVSVIGGRGGIRIRKVTVENGSQYVFNRHQLEGATLRLVEAAKDADPNLIEDLRIIGGPQLGVVETTAGSRISGAHITLNASFTNDFGLMLLADRIVARNNTIDGRSRGIQVDARDDVVEGNQIRTHEEPVNEEYDGCQLGGSFGIQLESRSVRAQITNNDVRVQATACDAKAFRATDVKPGNANRSSQNRYYAAKTPGAVGKAVAASFSGAKGVLLENDTLYADTWNAEINWDGAQDVVLKGVTFIKGTNAGKDYATFFLVPGSNNAVYKPTSAQMAVIDPTFRDGASADSFFMRPIGFEKWATPAEYSLRWTYSLTVTSPDGAPLSGVEVQIVDQKGAEVATGVTDQEGHLLPLQLTEFRRFNTASAIEKEVFSYSVRLSRGERSRSFPLRVSAPTSATEVLP